MPDETDLKRIGQLRRTSRALLHIFTAATADAADPLDAITDQIAQAGPIDLNRVGILFQDSAKHLPIGLATYLGRHVAALVRERDPERIRAILGSLVNLLRRSPHHDLLRKTILLCGHKLVFAAGQLGKGALDLGRVLLSCDSLWAS